MALEPGDIIDRYRVEAVLGEGGMSVVYRVRHVTLGTLHAMKVLSGRSKDLAARMQTEGSIQARLRHPNIVGVRDVLELEHGLALLLDYVHGPELRALCDEAAMSPDDALVVFRSVAAGVAFAHHSGFVHRDLKPANVLLQVRSDRVVPRVADFGLVKALGDAAFASRTRTGAAMGTPAYMAPEQVADAKGVDRRADLWSLGCMLYAMLTGSDPFQAPSVLGLFHRIATADYPPLAEVAPHVPERMVAAVDAMLQPDPRSRAADVVDVMEFLEGKRSEIPRYDVALQKLPDARDPSSLDGSKGLSRESEAGRRAVAKVPPRPPGPPTNDDPGIPTTHGGATPGPRSGLRVAGVALVVVALALVVGAGGMVSYRLTRPTSAVVPPPPEPIAVKQEPPPAPPPAPEPEPAPPAPAQPAPSSPTPAPAPAPAPVPVQAPAPVPSAPVSPPRAVVRFAGADAVVLVRDGRRFSLPSVPAGAYTVMATFDGAEVPAGTVEVPPSGDVTVACQAMMRRCAIR